MSIRSRSAGRGRRVRPSERRRKPPELGLDPDLAVALAGLSERNREIIALRYGADRTGPEIAELMGLTLANVQQIVSRSLRRLRAALEAPQQSPQPVSAVPPEARIP
jgi:DNA-directed RNA polymerase specialized sigma24 family protein